MASAALWSALSWAALSAHGFLVAAVVYRAVGASAFGVWATIGALRGFLLLFDGGLATSVSRDVALVQQGDSAAAIRVRTASRWCLGFAVLALLVGTLLAAAPGALLGLDADDAAMARWATLLTAIETALALAGSSLAGRLRGLHRFDRLAWTTLLYAAVGAALLWPLTARFGLCGAAAAALAARVVWVAVQAAMLHGHTPAVPSAPAEGSTADDDPRRAVLSFAAPLWLAALLACVGLSLDVPLVGAWFGDQVASAFALGTRLPGAGIGLLFAILAPAFPRLVQATPAARMRMGAALLCLAGVLSGAGFGFLALHSDALLSLWVGDAPPLARQVLWLYALAWALHAPAHVLSSMAIALGAHGALTRWVAAEAAVNLLLSVGLLALGCQAGPAWGTLATLTVASLVVVPAVLLRRLDLRWVGMLKPAATGLLLGLGAALLGTAAGQLATAPFLRLLTAAAVALAFTAAILDLTVRGQSTLARWFAIVRRGGLRVLWRQARQIARERVALAQERAAHPYVWSKSAPPLVTVRIATYRRGQLVADRAIASALAQTHRNLEILVVGDCCDEATADAVRGVRDPRVRFINLPERGRYPDDALLRWMVAGAAPMNHALDVLRGDWIAPLDDDDEFTPEHVEVLLDACRSRSLEFAWGKALVEGRDGTWSECGAPSLRPGSIAHVAVLYSARLRRFHHDGECWRIDEPGDWNLWQRFARAGVPMGFVDQVVSKHYVERREVADKLPFYMSRSGILLPQREPLSLATSLPRGS